MQPYRIVAIIKELVKDKVYQCVIVLIDAFNQYSRYVLPEGPPVNKGQIISFLVKRLKVEGAGIIWSETIEIPEI